MQRSIPRRLVCKLRDALRGPERHRVPERMFIHVGKCGGRSLEEALSRSHAFPEAVRIHVRKPPNAAHARYVIVARDPVDRARSALNWRRRLLLFNGEQVHRFPGEREILERYETIADLGQALYRPDGTPDPEVHRAARRIHHIREDIAFYLSDLLDMARPDQIVAVFMQEQLDHDIARHLGVSSIARVHDNREMRDADDLPEDAAANLRRFFRRDYELLRRLYDWGKLDETTVRRLFGDGAAPVTAVA